VDSQAQTAAGFGGMVTIVGEKAHDTKNMAGDSVDVDEAPPNVTHLAPSYRFV